MILSSIPKLEIKHDFLVMKAETGQTTNVVQSHRQNTGTLYLMIDNESYKFTQKVC